MKHDVAMVKDYADDIDSLLVFVSSVYCFCSKSINNMTFHRLVYSQRSSLPSSLKRTPSFRWTTRIQQTVFSRTEYLHE